MSEALGLPRIVSFPISRDPPEGGTRLSRRLSVYHSRFQFLGIPPKGELKTQNEINAAVREGFQFLGIPPKGER